VAATVQNQYSFAYHAARLTQSMKNVKRMVKRNAPWHISQFVKTKQQ